MPVDKQPVDTAQHTQQLPATQQGDRHDVVMVKEVVNKSVNAAQPIQQVLATKQGDKYDDVMVKKVVIKPVDTAQPIQQTPATKQGDKYDGVVVKEAVIKQVDTVQQPIQQVPVTQQPRKAIACSQERQVQLSMDTNSILLSSITDMSCDVLDLPQKEVVNKQVDIAYGRKDDVPDRLHNKVAIQLAPLLQQSPQPHLPLQQNRQTPSIGVGNRAMCLKLFWGTIILLLGKDISSMGVFTSPMGTAYGMEDDVPDLVHKKVAIKPPPLPQLPATQQQNRQAPSIGVGKQHGVVSPLPPEVETSKDKFPQQSLLQPPLHEQNRQAPFIGVGKQDGVVSPLPQDCQDKLAQQSLQQPPLQEQGRQDLIAVEDSQEPKIERSIIPQPPPHVQGPEDFRPLHNGAESTPPP